MASPIFSAMNPMGEMMKQFNEFRNNFKGNPREEVEKLLQSGQMSQSQLNQLQQMAQQFAQFMNG